MSHHATEIHFEQSVRGVHLQTQKSLIFQETPDRRIALFVASHPEDIHQFRIIWKDSRGQLRMNRGFCINYSTGAGPSRGPLRFHATANLDIIRFLGFEQLLKHAQLQEGASTFAAGADFDTDGKSSKEIVDFCSAFMTMVSKYSPITAESLTAELGVSPQTLKCCRSLLPNTHAKKDLLEPIVTDFEAAGISLICYAEAMVEYAEGKARGLRDQRIALSGSGKLALATAIRAIELGAIVLSLSDRKGSIVRLTGITIDQIVMIQKKKLAGASLASIMKSSILNRDTDYHPGEQPWQHVPGATLVLPCATQNELDLADAEALTNAKLKYAVEGSTMGCSQQAVSLFDRHRREGKNNVWYAPSKASTAASIAVCIEEYTFRTTYGPWDKHTWYQRLAETTQLYFKNVINAFHRLSIHNDGEDQLPDLDLGCCVLAVTNLARMMEEKGTYWH